MKISGLRPARTVIIAGTVTLVLGAGTAVAAAAVISDPSPVSSTGVIDGCWTNAALNGSHVIVLQNQGTKCPRGTTPISWNEQGPAGPSGPSGPAGPSGPSGPPGPPGPTTTVTATTTATVTATSTVTVTNPVPDNNCTSAVNLGTVGSTVGQGVSTLGVNEGSSDAWYTITFTGGFNLTVTGHAADFAPAGSDVMNVFTDCFGDPAAGAFSDTTSYTGSAGTYYVEVSEPLGVEANGGFLLSASASG